MRRKRKNSNWEPVLIVALIFIGIGITTYIVHTYSDKDEYKDNTTTNNTTKKDNDEEVKKEDNNKKEETDNKDTTKQETKNFKDQEGNDVKISGDKVVSATGFAGASNYKFYLRNGTLYFRNIANEDNKEEVIATGVKDLYLENKEVTAELSENGKIVKENNYITYK